MKVVIDTLQASYHHKVPNVANVETCQITKLRMTSSPGVGAAVDGRLETS